MVQGVIHVTKQNITAWFLEGGSVTIPKHLLAMMEPLGLSFEDLGKMVYLLYCGTDQIKRSDRYAQEAARTLHSKGLIHWFTDTETVDFSPMFDKISSFLGDIPQQMAYDREAYTANEMTYAQLVKNLEQQLGIFLSAIDSSTIQSVVQQYSWSYELVQEMYIIYYQKYRKQEAFQWFCQMAYGAQVHDKESLKAYVDKKDTISTKTTEVLRRLGKYNNPSEPQKEMYLKWTAIWKFTHEMILLAVEDTTGASNPSFNYLDGILSNWKERGITTPEALKEDKQRQQSMKEQFVSDRNTFERTAGDKHTSSSSGSAVRRKGTLPQYDTKKEDLDFLEW